MTIKRFKSFLEQNIAADYVAPADDDEEVKDYKPRSKGEEKFKNLHKVEVSPHPRALKHQHTTEETSVDEVMFPGSPEYKAKFDPKYNKYDPKGEMRKKLALKPYGDREDPEDSPVSNQTKGRGRPRKYADKNEEVEVEEQAPVAPTLDKKYVKGTPEYKAYMATKKPRVGHPTNVQKEEVEQVDELSKSTLASYAKKASHDARIKMATGKDFERISITSKKPAYKASAKDWENRYKSDARRREAGVNKAIDRLAKEEVEMDEMIRDVPLAKKVEQEYSDKLMKDFLAKGGQIKQGKPQKAPKNTLRFIARGSLASGERTITKTGSKSFTKRMGEEVEGVAEAKSSKYKIKAIGTDKRGDYYVHPTTGEKIYTAASKYPWEAPKRGDHVNPNTGKVTKESYDSVPASKALQKAHDDERKKRGLPDPSYYLKLAAQKKKEIEDLKNEK